MKTRTLIATLLTSAFVLAASLATSAQDMVHWGIISNIVGNYVTLDDGTMVEMREGTIIDPVGKPLYPGMRVRVKGETNDSGVFVAHIIDKVGATH